MKHRGRSDVPGQACERKDIAEHKNAERGKQIFKRVLFAQA